MNPTSRASLDVRKFFLALLDDLAHDKNFKNYFKAAHKEVHLFFWKLKQELRYKPFVEEFLFDTNGTYPHCDQIDELLQEFQLSGILSRPNPTYKYNDIAITDIFSGKDFKSVLLGDQKKNYEEILESFKQKLGIRESG